MIYIFTGLFSGALISLITTHLIDYLFKHYLTKYIPIFLALVLTVFTFTNINQSTGLRKKYYTISFIIWIEISVTMFITSVMIDLRNIKKNRKFSYDTYNL